MARRVIGSDIELRLHLGGGLGRVKADASRIHQVLMNLLVNARDAMPTGGVVVVATENLELDESAAARVPDVKPGSYVTFSVSDTGQGMTEQVQARIFEPFFTTKETGKGTGLGLATVWGIVSQHGGGIQVFSQPGVGSTFKVLLPRTSETGAKVDAETSHFPSPLGTERVLVVDDNTLVLDFMATALAAHGYRVRQAGSPTAALAIAREDPQGFALLLTDLSMPKMNGIELYAELKLRYPDLKVLYVSGHPPDLYPELMNSRALLLSKPFPAQRLLVRVREVLDG
jgi:CheY-like chemotaxis protein